MNRLSSFFHHALRIFDNAVFSSPRVTLGLIALVTVFFALQIPGVRMYSNFADLLPQGHAYIKLHNQIRDNFGGANNIIVGVEVKEGDIFTNERLAYIHQPDPGYRQSSRGQSQSCQQPDPSQHPQGLVERDRRHQLGIAL